MSKYEPLWQWIRENGEDCFSLTFARIEAICGFRPDHALLTYKKELITFGYQVKKISLKAQCVTFERLKGEAPWK